MARSVYNTASRPEDIQIILWLDEDDPTLPEYKQVCDELGILYLVGPRNVIHSSRWDRCLPLATGELLAHLNDDIVMKTQGWDDIVREWFDRSEDKLWLVGGDDAYLHSETVACHPIIHRRWLETIGYFIPPYFDGEWGDTWASCLAIQIGRKKLLPFVCEHLHFSRVDKQKCPNCGETTSIASVTGGDFCNRCGTLFNEGKSRMDQTTLDYIARAQEQNPAKIYDDRESERFADSEKLRKKLGTPWSGND